MPERSPRIGRATPRSMSTEDRRRARQVLWSLRGLVLFLVGPVIGVGLVAAIFGLPQGLQLLAGIMFLFSLAILALLVRGEWRRLAGER